MTENDVNRRLTRLRRRVRELEGGQTPPHVVIALPKAGGSTITATVQAAFPRHEVYHPHVLSIAGLEGAAAMWQFKDHEPEANKIAAKGHLEFALRCRERLLIDELREEKMVAWFICSVREPISLAISAFFQGYERHLSNGTPIDTDGVHRWVTTKRPLRGDEMPFAGGLDGWMQREILDELQFDVFAEPFDTARGHQVYEKPGSKLLVIRQENFDLLPKALGNFYRLPESCFETVNENRASDKEYDAAYREVRARIRFDPEFLDEVYGSRYATTFYSEKERREFKKKWSGER